MMSTNEVVLGDDLERPSFGTSNGAILPALRCFPDDDLNTSRDVSCTSLLPRGLAGALLGPC